MQSINYLKLLRPAWYFANHAQLVRILNSYDLLVLDFDKVSCKNIPTIRKQVLKKIYII